MKNHSHFPYIVQSLFSRATLSAAQRQGRDYTCLAKRSYPGVEADVNLASGRVHYTEAGNGDPVVLVHGLGASVMRWVPTIQAFQNDYRVIAYDHPGFGKSQKGQADYTIPYYSSCLEEFLEVLDLTNVTLVGHSLGGATVLDYLHQRSERIARAVVLSPAAIHLPHNFLERSIGKVLLRLPFISGMFERGLNRCVVKKTEWVQDMLFHAEGLRGDPEWAEINKTLRRVASHLLEFSLADSLHRIKTPLLVVWGEEDALQPADLALGIHHSVPLARIAILPECGHYPMLEVPDEFHRCLREFLQGTEYIHGCEH
jgi:pimeloyl-ACP methyl ester carboxylesterase